MLAFNASSARESRDSLSRTARARTLLKCNGPASGAFQESTMPERAEAQAASASPAARRTVFGMRWLDIPVSPFESFPGLERPCRDALRPRPGYSEDRNRLPRQQ